MRIMNSHPFFGVMLHDLKFVFSTHIDTFSTDGETISFNPYYLKDLSPSEIDTCILHVLIHISLKHHLRYPNIAEDQLMQRACDIVTNSNLMYSLDNNMREIMVQGRVLPHKTPSGVEGYLLSVEDVYQSLLQNLNWNEKQARKNSSNGDYDYLQADSFNATNVPIEKNKLFKVNADASKRLYLKQNTYVDYFPFDREIAWTNDARLSFFDVDKFTYENLSKYPKHSKLHLKIILSEKMMGKDMPVPTYASDNSRFDSVVKKEEEIDYECLSFKFDREALNYFANHTNKTDIAYQSDLNNYLDIPDNIKSHFDELNKKLKWKNASDLIFKVRDYVATTFDYDIKYPKAPNSVDPIIYFAEISKKGKCTHFATYMTLMLRYFNIPARVVGGFMTSTSSFEDVDVYLENLHAWVEVYIHNLGWVTIDPTPVLASFSAGKGNGNLDSHNEWKPKPNDKKDKNLKEDEINKKLHEAYKVSKDLKAGTIPQAIETEIIGLTDTKIDWRVLLNDFVQDEVCDYAFTPPDNRLQGSPFLLPSFSERDEKIKKVLFMVDVSGSMSDDQISECFNEINGSITQFNGKIEGFVGFFDYDVKDIQPFGQDTDILSIKPYGRGGTNFFAVFDKIKEDMKDDLPSKIIILSDGYAHFPEEDAALGIPVLWIINNEDVTPPWGKLVRLK